MPGDGRRSVARREMKKCCTQGNNVARLEWQVMNPAHLACQRRTGPAHHFTKLVPVLQRHSIPRQILQNDVRESRAADRNAGPWGSATPSVPRPRTGPALGADASINGNHIIRLRRDCIFAPTTALNVLSK
jgi:hypothetical protein